MPSFLIYSILKYREMVNYVNSILEDAIDEMPLTKKEYVGLKAGP